MMLLIQRVAAVPSVSFILLILFYSVRSLNVVFLRFISLYLVNKSNCGETPAATLLAKVHTLSTHCFIPNS